MSEAFLVDVSIECFSKFLDKNIILCILKGEMPIKMCKIIYIFFLEKKNIKKNTNVSYLT